MDYIDIARQQLKILEPSGQLVLEERKTGSASVCRDEKIFLNPSYIKHLTSSNEVLHFSNGSWYRPNTEEIIATIVAHEVAHWRCGHVDKGKKSLKNFVLSSVLETAAKIIAVEAVLIAPILLLGSFFTDTKALNQTSFTRKEFALGVVLMFLIGLSIAAVFWLFSAHYHIKYMNEKREREHEADTHAMELLKKIGKRPEAELWIEKAEHSLYKGWKGKKDPDRSLRNKVVYLRNATHPTSFYRYHRCLTHLKKIRST